MEENQNEIYGNEAPRTYGDESRMYENQTNQASGQPYDNQLNQQYNVNQQYDQQYNNMSQQYGQQYNNMNQQYNQQYNNMNQQYGQQNYQQSYMGYGSQMMPASVKDIFCNILLVIMPIRMILSIIITYMTFKTMNYESLLNGNYQNYLLRVSGSHITLSTISNVLWIAYIVFVVLDIINVHKGHYKITGLILFAIFLEPGYYIWRAYVLKRQKTWPIVYTVLYTLLMAVNMIIAFYFSFQMVFVMMKSVY